MDRAFKEKNDSLMIWRKRETFSDYLKYFDQSLENIKIQIRQINMSLLQHLNITLFRIAFL